MAVFGVGDLHVFIVTLFNPSYKLVKCLISYSISATKGFDCVATYSMFFKIFVLCRQVVKVYMFFSGLEKNAVRYV